MPNQGSDYMPILLGCGSVCLPKKSGLSRDSSLRRNDGGVRRTMLLKKF